MAEVKNNIVTHGMSGSIGKQLVFKRYGNRTIVSAMPDMSKVVKSKKQKSENTKFRQSITDVRFRDAIDGVIDPLIVQAIADRLNLSPEPIEQRLNVLSVDCALLSGNVLSVIGSKVSMANIPAFRKNSQLQRLN